MSPTGNKTFFPYVNPISLTWKAGRPDFSRFKYSRSSQFHQRNVETIATNHVIFMNFYALYVVYVLVAWVPYFNSPDLSYTDIFNRKL